MKKTLPFVALLLIAAGGWYGIRLNTKHQKAWTDADIDKAMADTIPQPTTFFDSSHSRFQALDTTERREGR